MIAGRAGTGRRERRPPRKVDDGALGIPSNESLSASVVGYNHFVVVVVVVSVSPANTR